MDERDNEVVGDLNPQPTPETIDSQKRTRERFAKLKRMGMRMAETARIETQQEPEGDELYEAILEDEAKSRKEADRVIAAKTLPRPEALEGDSRVQVDSANRVIATLVETLQAMTTMLIEHEHELLRMKHALQEARF
jgi:hypothetical protein